MAHEIKRPTGKSVWMAKDLRNSTEWVFPLPPDALAEIDDCVRRCVARGVTGPAATRDDFPMHTLQPQIQAMQEEISTGRGFVVIRGLSVEHYSLEELHTLYWGFGAHFGIGMVQSFLGDRIGDIRDVSDEEPDPRKRRGYHSGGFQPVHTDSCDIVSMLSIRMAKLGGASTLASAHTVHNMMLDTCPGLLDAFYDGFYLRTTDSDAAAAGRPALSPHRVPPYKYVDGQLNCSFVRGYVERAVTAGDVKLSATERAAVEVFTAFSNHPDICLDMLLQPGDMQFVNNRTMLHGRAHFEDYPEKALRRHLLRLWLTVPAWDRLPAEQDTHSDQVKQKWAERASLQPAAAE